MKNVQSGDLVRILNNVIDRYTIRLFKLAPEIKDIAVSFYSSTHPRQDVCVRTGIVSDYNPKTIEEYLDVVETLDQRRIITYGKTCDNSKFDPSKTGGLDYTFWNKMWKKHNLHSSEPYLDYIEKNKSKK